MRIVRRNYNGKYFNVLIDEKGKRLSWRKWDNSFKIKEAVRKFKKDKTLEEDVHIVPLAKVTEIIDYSDRSKGIHKAERRAGITRFQVQAEITVRRQTIVARSFKHTVKYSYEKAKNEAKKTLLSRIGKLSGETYDEDGGLSILGKRVSEITYSTVFYK